MKLYVHNIKIVRLECIVNLEILWDNKLKYLFNFLWYAKTILYLSHWLSQK
jgi:hypothetical protein